MLFNINPAPMGETLIVTAPAGVTVSVSKDTITKTRIADSNGYATFKGLTAGIWTVTITDGVQTSSRTIDIKIGYSIAISFFTATITVNYPEGSTCTCSDGITTLTASDTSGKFIFNVPNAGSWTITSTDNTFTKTETVNITTDGQNDSIELIYAYYLFNAGDSCESATGGWEAISHPLEGTYGKEPTLSVSNATMSAEFNATRTTRGIVKTKNAVDLSNYKSLVFVVTDLVDPAGLNTIGVIDDLPEKAINWVKSAKAMTGENVIDISDVSGSYAIGMLLGVSDSNTGDTRIACSKIYLQ